MILCSSSIHTLGCQSQELRPKHVRYHPSMQIRITLSLNFVLLLLCYIWRVLSFFRVCVCVYLC